MAGMQYYFFPTDFYYPRPQSVTMERPACDQLLPPVEVQKLSSKDIDHEDQKVNMVRSNVSENKVLKKNLPYSSIGLCRVRFDDKREEPSSFAIALYSALSAYNFKEQDAVQKY